MTTQIDGQSLYESIIKKDETTYEKVKSFYSKKKYLLNTPESISIENQKISGNSLQYKFRMPIQENNDIVEKINNNNSHSLINYDSFQSFVRDNIKYLNTKTQIRPIHSNLLKKQILNAPVKFLREVINKINNNVSIEMEIKGETLIDIYVLFGEWINFLKEDYMVNIFKYSFIILFNIYYSYFFNKNVNQRESKELEKIFIKNINNVPIVDFELN
jgi:hypothetical protein